MKILLNWTTCESRKQCTRPNDRDANALKCNPNSTLVAYSPMKQIKKIFFFFLIVGFNKILSNIIKLLIPKINPLDSNIIKLRIHKINPLVYESDNTHWYHNSIQFVQINIRHTSTWDYLSTPWFDTYHKSHIFNTKYAVNSNTKKYILFQSACIGPTWFYLVLIIF